MSLQRRNTFCTGDVKQLPWGVECVMKIYLLMMLIGTLLTIIRFTSVPEQRAKNRPGEPAAG
jgi:hypothetical protein